MSRVGNKPIAVPSGVEVQIRDNEVTVKGPKGELSRSFPGDIGISLQDGVITVSRPTDSRTHRALHGFTRSILSNMVEGVSAGFRKNLELHGVGYRAQKSEVGLSIQVGYSQPIHLLRLIEITPSAVERSFITALQNRVKARAEMVFINM